MNKAAKLILRLSAPERSSLRRIGMRSLACRMPGQRIPFRHAEKLIRLGLAELIFGEPGLTGGGRRALGLMEA
jgi:hypothetical protein